MFCPQCGEEYREGFNVCSDCGVSLIPEAEFRKREAIRMAEDARRRKIKTAEVSRVQGEAEAGVIRSLLAAHGIETIAIGSMVQSVYPFTVDGLGEIRILVREEDAESARKLITAHEENNPAEPDA